MRFLLFLCILLPRFPLSAAVLNDRFEEFQAMFASRRAPQAMGNPDPRLQLLCSHIPQLFHETDQSVNALIDAYAKLSLPQLRAIAHHASVLFLSDYKNSTRVKIVEAASVLLPHEIRARAEAFASHHSFLRASCLDHEEHAYVTSLALTLQPLELDDRARLMKLYLNWLYPDGIQRTSSLLVSIVVLDTPAYRLRESFGQIIRLNSTLFRDALNPNSRVIAILNLLQIRPDSIPVIADLLEENKNWEVTHETYKFLCGLFKKAQE